MKKLLSILLALSMIISCVSMMTFVVNAEDTSVGIKIAGERDWYLVLGGDTVFDDIEFAEGETQKTIEFTLYNGSEESFYVEIIPITTSWGTLSGYNGSGATLHPGAPKTISVTIPKTAADGTGYTDFTLRINARTAKGGDTRAFAAGDCVYVIPSEQSIAANAQVNGTTVTKITELEAGVGIKVKADATGYSIVSDTGGLFKDLEFAAGETEKDVQLKLYNASANTFTVKIYPINAAATGWDMFSGYTAASKKLVPGETYIMNVKIPKGANDAYKNYGLKIEYSGITVGDVLYISPLDQNVAAAVWSYTYGVKFSQITELPAEIPQTDPVAIKLTGTGSADSILTGAFKNAETQEGMTITTAQFAVYSKNELSINKFYAADEWEQTLWDVPGQPDGDINYTTSVTLPANEVKIVKLTVPTTYYLPNATVNDGKSYTELDLRIEYGRSLTADDVIYIVPLHEDNIIDLASIYGPAMEQAWDIPFTMPAPEATPAAVFLGAQVDVGSTLTMNYVATVADKCDDPYVVFTRNEKDTTVYGVKQSDGTYLFAYEGINAQCMSDVITAKLYSGNEELATANDYSVRQNAINLYNNTEDTTLKTLLADMLAYGSASQTYTGYNTGNLANDGLNWAETSSFDPGQLKTDGRIITGNTTANKVKSVGMNISNVYKLYFTLEIDETVDVYLDGDLAQVEGNRVYTDAIKATGNKTSHTIILMVGDEVISTVTYCVDDYIRVKQNDAQVGAIVKAIANYGQSATAYAAAQ